MTSKVDKAWEKYIEEKGFVLNGQVFEVEASDIKQITQVEPRILAKFDYRHQLPEVLAQAEYSILPITNGTYVLAPGNPFFSVIPPHEPIQFLKELPFTFYTLGRNSGESGFLDTAYIYGILQDFTKCSELYLTIRGRERVNAFTFNFGSNIIRVNGVQIEVDGGYEGKEDILLIEAKVGTKTEFNIRQLYYPYRHFRGVVPTKNIRPILLEYDFIGSTFNFYEFAFSLEDDFQSIHQISAMSYQLAKPEKLRIDEFIDDLYKHECNFVPQADDLNKVFELVILLSTTAEDAKSVSDFYEITYRQGHYYSEASDYLGLVQRIEGEGLFLTENGRRLVSGDNDHQQRIFAKAIVNSWIFRTLIVKFKGKKRFTSNDIEEILRTCRDDEGNQRYSGSTIPRRRQTIVAWINWLHERYGIFEETSEGYLIK